LCPKSDGVINEGSELKGAIRNDDERKDAVYGGGADGGGAGN